MAAVATTKVKSTPKSSEVGGLRALMVQGGSSAFGLGTDFAILLAAFVVLIALAARLFPRLVR